MSKQLVIDEEIRAVLPPPTEEEVRQLEEKLGREGCTEKLHVWQGRLIDGFARHDVCRRLGIGYETVEVEGIGDRGQAIDWRVRHNLARRHLPSVAWSYLNGRLYASLPGEQGKRNDLGGTSGGTRRKSDDRRGRADAELYRAVERLAEAIGSEVRDWVLAGRITRKDVPAVERLAEKFGPELRDQVLAGRITRKDVLRLARMGAGEQERWAREQETAAIQREKERSKGMEERKARRAGVEAGGKAGHAPEVGETEAAGGRRACQAGQGSHAESPGYLRLMSAWREATPQERSRFLDEIREGVAA
jgi:hypothetical protein